MSSVVIRIAKNEFSRCIGNPIVITATAFLCISTLIFVAGQYAYVQNSHAEPVDSNVLFLNNITGSAYFISMALSFVSLCIGIVALAGERYRGSMRVLLTKPLYRRDIILGKFIGINFLMLLLVIFVISICIAFNIAAFGLPSAFSDDILRTVTLTILLFMQCMIFTSIVLFCGVIFKNLYMSLILSVSFFILVWLMSWPFTWVDVLKLIDPVVLYLTLIRNYSNVDISFLDWVSEILPYAVYMFLVILVIFIIDCYFFTNEET
ncbi:MAG: ABC-2 family transporter protein [Methanocella sp. PtaU1.Bin125]|nr:MAG: ABC-2 family transporter protein [Methanocella sp. PtaU1.Bin125]